MMGSKVAILEMSVNTMGYFSVRLPTQGMVHPQGYFGELYALFCNGEITTAYHMWTLLRDLCYGLIGRSRIY
jgi:hypothetical protein